MRPLGKVDRAGEQRDIFAALALGHPGGEQRRDMSAPTRAGEAAGAEVGGGGLLRFGLQCGGMTAPW